MASLGIVLQNMYVFGFRVRRVSSPVRWSRTGTTSMPVSSRVLRCRVFNAVSTKARHARLLCRMKSCSYQQSCSQLGSQRQERRRPFACFRRMLELSARRASRFGVDRKSTNRRIDRSMNLLTWVWSRVGSCCSVAWSLASAFFMNMTDRAFVCFQHGAGVCIAVKGR
jgi:hypothetical protein